MFKKGNQTAPTIYRPVSISSHLIKVFEREIRKKLVQHLEDNALVTDSQHGFRKTRSCLTQLLHHVDHILKCLNSGDEVDTIYLDYAKAFDKVDHQILLAKLKKYGITGKAHAWVAEFLTNRFQTVVVEGRKSTFQAVISVVPQGTVLGPLLFILYINNIIEVLKTAKGLCFADDTKLTCAISGEADHTNLQEDLWRVIAWSIENNMKLHESKFEVMNYCLNTTALLRKMPFSSSLYEYSTAADAIEETVIEPAHTVRDLGVHLSVDCSWTKHIQITAKSASKMAAGVMSVFRERSPLLMLTLFKSMVRSVLEYSCAVWDPSKIAEWRHTSP